MSLYNCKTLHNRMTYNQPLPDDAKWEFKKVYLCWYFTCNITTALFEQHTIVFLYSSPKRNKFL